MKTSKLRELKLSFSKTFPGDNINELITVLYKYERSRCLSTRFKFRVNSFNLYGLT